MPALGNWGEPKQAPHRHVVHELCQSICMSVCVRLSTNALSCN